MADLEGSGFVAGMVQAVSVKENSDAWYHTGIPTCLMVNHPLGSGYDGVMYRIFGPDPVFFETSASLRFGTKANDTESLIYSYLEPAPAQDILSPDEWLVAGPFECNSYEEFIRHEWAEEPIEEWPVEHLADFGVYLSNLRDKAPGPTLFKIPDELPYEHGWCDFVRSYRGRGVTNLGAQPTGASAYAAGEIRLSDTGEYQIKVAYDDWIRVWINGKEVYSGRHEDGFAGDRKLVKLPAGKAKVLIKLSNSDNRQWRNWAFALRFEPLDE